jgi:hypothetical protein
MKEEQRAQPLFVSDVMDQGRSASAVMRDIDEELNTGNQAQLAVNEEMKRSHALLREVSFGVLTRLEYLGDDNIEDLRSRLQAIDPIKNPMMSDMSAVEAELADAELQAANDEDKQKFNRQSKLARAVSAIATANAVMLHENGLSNRTIFLTGYATETVDSIEAFFSDTTILALRGLVSELVPPDQNP